MTPLMRCEEQGERAAEEIGRWRREVEEQRGRRDGPAGRHEPHTPAQSSAVAGIAEIPIREGNLSGAKALHGPTVQILRNYNQPLSCVGS